MAHPHLRPQFLMDSSLLARLSLFLVAFLAVVACQKKEESAPPAVAKEPLAEKASAPIDEKEATFLLARAGQALSVELGPLEAKEGRAREAVGLTSRALDTIESDSEFSPSLASQLFLLRGRALFILKEYPAGHWSVSSAALWAGRLDPPDLILQSEISLAHAYAYSEEGDLHQVRFYASDAAKAAGEASVKAGPLECEALLLLAGVREEEAKREGQTLYAPEYRQIFAVIRRYNYPENLWHIAYSTLPKLGDVDESEMKRLMGTIPFATFEKAIDRSEVDQLFQKQQEEPKSEEKSASGLDISGLEPAVVVGEMRDEFRACYEAELAESPRLQGRVALSLHIAESGYVRKVKGRSLELSSAVTDCVVDRALLGRFAPPEGGYQRIDIPLRFTPEAPKDRADPEAKSPIHH